MTENNEKQLIKLQQLLKQKKSKAFYANQLSVTIEKVDELLQKLKGEKPDLEGVTKKIDVEKGTIQSTRETTFDPQTIEELAKLHKIDLSRYKISNYWSKLKPNGKFTSSVFATIKQQKDYTPEDFTKFLEKWKPNTKLGSRIWVNLEEDKEEVDIELNIADFHLAKRTFQKDSLESKEFDYYKAVVDLIDKVRKVYNIRKLVFPIGNDMFHTDNYQNGTTFQTPQDVTVWYDEEYEKGFDILANSINYLVTQAKEVEIILVQGNHDRTKAFYVAHALEIFFKDYKNLKFQRHHSVIKHTVVGNTFIGYHHGNNCKLDNLPILFATSPGMSEDFGKAKYREIHTGDKHHYLAKEITGSGVKVQQMPSLSGHDRWHTDAGFVNQVRAALLLVYHPIQGKIAEFETRI